MQLPFASLLLLSTLSLGAPAPLAPSEVDAATAAALDKRKVYRFKYITVCREKPWEKLIARFPPGAYIDVRCYHWHNGDPKQVWYFTGFGCWVPSEPEVIPNLPPC